MSDIALLGFAVDSAPLDKAKTSARNAAQEIGKLGDVADSTSGKVDKIGKNMANTGQSSDKMAKDIIKANAAIEQFARGLQLSSTHSDAASTGMKRLLEQAAAVSPAMQRAAGSIGGLAGSLGGMGGGGMSNGLAGGAARAAEGIGSVVKNLGPMGMVAGGVAAVVVTLAGAYYKAAESLAVFQDRQTQNVARLKNALGEGSDPAGTVLALQKQANEAGISADNTIDAFARIARNGEALGASTNQLLQLSETIQKLGIVSNASAGEISAGQLQLSQALASGKLNGDELRSVMENLPALAKAIADGLGVSVGQLRSMGAAGELTGDKVFKALLSQTEKVREEFKTLPDTAERAQTRMENGFDRVKARIGEVIGASQIMQATFNRAAAAFEAMLGDAPSSIDGIQKRIDQLTNEKINTGGGIRGFFANNAGRDEEIKRLQGALMDMQRRESSTKTADAAKAASAELQRALGVAKDVDDAGTRKAKILGDQKTMAEGLVAAKKAMAEAAAEAAKYATQVSNLSGAISFQLSRTSVGVDDHLGGLFNPQQAATNYVAMNAVDRLRPQKTAAEKARDAALARQEEAAAAIRQLQASSVINDKALDASNKADPANQRKAELDGLERQIAAQQALAGAVGKSRGATRELEAAQEAMEYRVRTFGDKTTPDAIAATDAYASATLRLKKAQDSVADARAFQGIRDTIAGVKAQTEAVINGEYAVRRTAAQQAARLADRETPGMGGLKMKEFDAGEQLSLAQQLDALKISTMRTEERIGTIGNTYAERQLDLENRIADARRKTAPAGADALEAAMREDAAASEIERNERSKTAAVDRLAALSDERGLIQYTGRELAVQTAMMAKRRDLEAQGVSMASAYYDEQMKIAKLIAEDTFDNATVKERADEMRDTLQSGLSGLKGLTSGVFSDMFANGETSAAAFFARMENAAANFADRLLNSLVLNPAFDMLTNKSGSGLLDSFIGNLSNSFSGAYPGAKPTEGFLASIGGAINNAKGAAFLGGHDLGLASGGILHGPTMFGMGGGRSGVAGEAGAEGVLPLRRAANGKLGVESTGGGGGTTVQVFDQRTNTNAEPVNVQERRGDDGKKMIYVTIRDNVKTAIRSGDMDNDMRGQFGVGRPVTRR
jgi:tape measure domain-containing protein